MTVRADPQTLLQLQDIRTYFPTQDCIVTAVDGVSLSIRHGETLGVVGESGFGKRITALLIRRLIERPGRAVPEPLPPGPLARCLPPLPPAPVLRRGDDAPPPGGVLSAVRVPSAV